MIGNDLYNRKLTDNNIHHWMMNNSFFFFGQRFSLRKWGSMGRSRGRRRLLTKQGAWLDWGPGTPDSRSWPEPKGRPQLRSETETSAAWGLRNPAATNDEQFLYFVTVHTLHMSFLRAPPVRLAIMSPYSPILQQPDYSIMLYVWFGFF